jgi:hypothetical protein
MRTTIIRTATFAAIFILPLSLPQAYRNGNGTGIFGASTASADGTLNRLMRWSGYGWSCGYHACNNNGWGLRDGLPPVGNTASKKQPTTRNTFELVAPGQAASTDGSHWGGNVMYGHYHTPMMHQNYVGSVTTSSASSGEMGGSLLAPQATEPGDSVQQYRSSVSPSVPRRSANKSKDREETSPSDLEILPSPKGDKDGLDKLMNEDDSAHLLPPRNRSARIPAAIKAR